MDDPSTLTLVLPEHRPCERIICRKRRDRKPHYRGIPRDNQ